MARRNINTGSSPNKGDGDPTRTAWTKANENFTELYDRVETLEEGPGSGTTLTQDIIGSVYAEDSSVMVDSASSAFVGQTLTLTPGDVPANPADGMLAVADGVNWVPVTSGQQTLMVYLNGSWTVVA